MTKEELIKRLKDLSDDRFSQAAPFIEAGRRSAASEPILDAKDVCARVRLELVLPVASDGLR